MRASLLSNALLGGLPLALHGPRGAIADLAPFRNNVDYDESRYGKYPVQEFKSTNAQAPRVNLRKEDHRCQNDLYTFFTPRGYVDDARKSQASIFDSNGYLIWTTGWPHSQIYDLMVQEYRGEDYLTFWAGNDAVGGHGAGHYFMLDKHYNLTRQISGADNKDADLHDFQITSEGTALMTVYEIKDVDLTSVNKTVGPIWDCIVQEVDLETDELLFSWRASDHIPINASYHNPENEDGDPGGPAWDWFHINSVDKDDKGNYIISSRWIHSIHYIEHETGHVKWTLGGKYNDFSDLSDGNATNFEYQHHARWADEGFANITIFDNGAYGGDKPARGLRVQVDQEAMTAELVNEYLHPDLTPSASQGSVQDLPNGNVLLGYGFSAAWAEFSRDGEILCDTHYAPTEGFGHGDAQSYRVLKYGWKGLPLTNPSLAMMSEVGVWKASVSWNGATEVRQWVLEGTHNEDVGPDDWDWLMSMRKVGFETQFQLDGRYSWLRAKALDAGGEVLGMSGALDVREYQLEYPVLILPTEDEETPAWVWGIIGAVCGASFVLLLVGLWAMWKNYRAGSHVRKPSSRGYQMLGQREEDGTSMERKRLE